MKNQEDDLLDDLEGLNDPPPPTTKQLERREFWLSAVVYSFIFIGGIALLVFNKPKSRKADLDMERIDRLIKSTQNINYKPINIDELKRMQEAVEQSNVMLDSLRMEKLDIKALEKEYKARQKE
ncbi:MAG: hypothetical protein GY810_15165 [Aureispira sp.]|nr:hypothetical protein [Aureispira sp.]